jgi:hypothetical protein
MRRGRLPVTTPYPRATALLLAVSMVCIVPACGSDDNPAGPGSGGGGGSAGGGAGSVGPQSMRATVDGVPWTGVINVASIATGNFLVVTGASDLGGPNETLITLSTPAQVGTQTVASNLVVGAYVTSRTTGWITIPPAGSGTVTVTSLTPTRATGTFSFVMMPNSGAAAPLKVVTDGSFDAQIPTP